jgi:phage regulator Rha-like protein
VQAAQLQAQARVKEATISAQGEQAYIATQQQIGRDDHAARMGELQMKRELAILDYANKNQMQLNQVKADLAMLALKLNSDHAMSNAERQTRAAEQSGPADAATPARNPDAELQ